MSQIENGEGPGPEESGPEETAPAGEGAAEPSAEAPPTADGSKEPAPDPPTASANEGSEAAAEEEAEGAGASPATAGTTAEPDQAEPGVAQPDDAQASEAAAEPAEENSGNGNGEEAERKAMAGRCAAWYNRLRRHVPKVLEEEDIDLGRWLTQEFFLRQFTSRDDMEFVHAQLKSLCYTHVPPITRDMVNSCSRRFGSTKLQEMLDSLTDEQRSFVQAVKEAGDPTRIIRDQSFDLIQSFLDATSAIEPPTTNGASARKLLAGLQKVAGPTSQAGRTPSRREGARGGRERRTGGRRRRSGGERSGRSGSPRPVSENELDPELQKLREEVKGEGAGAQPAQPATDQPAGRRWSLGTIVLIAVALIAVGWAAVSQLGQSGDGIEIPVRTNQVQTQPERN